MHETNETLGQAEARRGIQRNLMAVSHWASLEALSFRQCAHLSARHEAELASDYFCTAVYTPCRFERVTSRAPKKQETKHWSLTTPLPRRSSHVDAQDRASMAPPMRLRFHASSAFAPLKRRQMSRSARHPA